MSPQPFAKLIRPLATFVVFASPCWTLGCAPDGSGGGSSGGGAAQVPAWNGDLVAETAYATTNGHGSVTVVNDATINDIGISSIVNGQRIIRWNPNAAASTPQFVAEWFSYHELGHHFRDHMHHYLGKYAEYESDAFAARVLYQRHGASAVQAVIGYWLSSGNPGNGDHRTGVERAGFIQTVLDAVQLDPTAVPTPPTQQIIPVTAAYFQFNNPLAGPVYVFINGGNVGPVLGGGSGIVAVAPGTYYVEYRVPPFFSLALASYYTAALGEFRTVP